MNKENLNKNNTVDRISRAIASLAVCSAGSYSMHVSSGETGIG